MSNRTLLEINHDCAHEIELDPTGFARALVSYLRSGDADRGNSLRLPHFGITIGPMRHHSDPDPLEGLKRNA